MASKEELTDEEREKFFQNSERLGFTREQVAGTRIHTGEMGTVVLGADLDVYPVPAIRHTLSNAKELKARIGVPDQWIEEGRVSDKGVAYPASAPAPHMESLGHLALSEPERQAVGDALNAYVNGHSKKVIDQGWEPIINASRFPMVATASASENVIVKPGEPLVINTESAHSFGKVILEPGGQIIVAADSQASIVTLVKET